MTASTLARALGLAGLTALLLATPSAAHADAALASRGAASSVVIHGLPSAAPLAKTVGELEAQCAAEVSAACIELATHHLAKADATATYLGADLLLKACKKGDLVDCGKLAEIYEMGSQLVVRDEDRAATLHQRACRGGVTSSCRKSGALSSRSAAR